MPELHVVIASTRPGRAGLPIGNWFVDAATRHGKFDVKKVDLLEVALPLMDEPNHPRLRKYEHEHTKRWSASVDAADAFVFVTPEYNYGSPPALINAIDYVFHEWAYKPVGFVSYGGLSGGTRSVQMTKLVVTTAKMMPLPEAVNIPFFSQFIKGGVFVPQEAQEKSATAMLDELLRWTDALRVLRKPTG
ncbi:MAG TPA: NAD(P)H-dependent oxidoreductase [Polyangiaceae bacterium]|nr:NAD(P)H-dependent oxidoreductase [Polyangiaceae bacterium]